MAINQAHQIPRIGMFATVRNRRGVVTAVEPFDGDAGRLHLVHIEYKDDQLPHHDKLLWEIEIRPNLLEPTALPDVSRSSPMPPEDFDALLRAARWTATSPYLDPDGSGPVDRLPISSPFHGAVQIEDFQLVPLLKALRMPRVNLLLADDVGLGKTIEAGLILSELLIRRRVQRVLILTPASLRRQWRDEMWEKFSLRFDLVDREETDKLRRRLGMDANPWRSFSRIIASYYYLRQEDVLEQFMASSRTPEGSPRLPWDLLIVDECHNLMPSVFGDDSDLCRMIRLVAPQFEHKLFLSATPHNGHTRCFTGLLEVLDPVRFSQTSELKTAEKERIQQVVLRRLKREINARSDKPRFCDRQPPKAIVLSLSSQEAELSKAFNEFRSKVKKLIAQGDRRRRRAGSFAVEILGKRLLSCPIAFAESWRRSKEGLTLLEAASDDDVNTAERNVRRETDDDKEAQKREDTAANVVGAWLKTMSGDLDAEIAALDKAVADLDIDTNGVEILDQDPSQDARLNALFKIIDELLMKGNKWRDDERLVVFTEYKTTLDYIMRRLRDRYDDERILMLFGGMDELERDLIKKAFNDPDASVRILIATDAAAEGLNLQRTARYLLHYDCPWNPSKLEQRNGRLDRHGQGRDVTVFHFVSDQDQDLAFLAHVIRKAHEIREDLGSVNELFDEAAHRRLVGGEDIDSVRRDLDSRVSLSKGRASIKADDTVATSEGATPDDIAAIASELDLDSLALCDTLESAMAVRGARPQFTRNTDMTCRILHPELPGWSEVIDESLRKRTDKNTLGPVASITFSPEPFMETMGERSIFTPRPDLLMMHLSHPMIQKALSTLTRFRFPGSSEMASRWAVRLNGIPKEYEAMILLSVEEIAVNDLRESFHHWVRTIALPFDGTSLGNPLPHAPAVKYRGASATTKEVHKERAKAVIEETEEQIKQVLETHRKTLTKDLRVQIEKDGERARKEEEVRYRSRQGEISKLIADNTLAKLEKEIEKLKALRAQGQLFDEGGKIDSLDRSIEEKEEEITRRKSHYEEVRGQLEKERERILKYLLPKRYNMTSEVQVFPVCIEVRLRAKES